MANLTIKQASEIINFSVDHTRKLVRDGVIKAKKIGRDYIITKSALIGIERQRNKSIKKPAKGRKRKNGKRN